VEQDVSGLQSGEIHAHCLSRLKGCHNSPHIELWACCPPIANRVKRAAGFLVASASCLSRCKRGRRFFDPPRGAKPPAGRRRYSARAHIVTSCGAR
jgi:hypothetical protein